MTDAELEERIDQWSATGEPVAIIVVGVALVGRVLGRQGALVRFRPWGRDPSWIALADINAAGAFGEPSLEDRRVVSDRQACGLSAVELEGKSA